MAAMDLTEAMRQLLDQSVATKLFLITEHQNNFCKNVIIDHAENQLIYQIKTSRTYHTSHIFKMSARNRVSQTNRRFMEQENDLKVLNYLFAFRFFMFPNHLLIKNNVGLFFITTDCRSCTTNIKLERILYWYYSCPPSSPVCILSFVSISFYLNSPKCLHSHFTFISHQISTQK
jgi:hypothetical protein